MAIEELLTLEIGLGPEIAVEDENRCKQGHVQDYGNQN
jgi:hypothetical protein